MNLMSLHKVSENRDNPTNKPMFPVFRASPSVLQEYLSLKDLARYSGVSIRRLRSYLCDSIAPLPYYQPAGGKIVVRVSEFNDWMKRFRREGSGTVDRIVAELLKGVA